MVYPELYKVRRRFSGEHVADVAAEVRRQMENAGVDWAPGSSIAITCGSRGIANIALIIKTMAAWLMEKGVKPFVVPAMGSHGGATGEGQRQVVESYGVTEAYIGVPIRSSMEVVELPRGESPAPVYMDKNAWESDGVIIVNRVKVHTDFHGDNESGMMKMCVIGLGKHKQALAAHQYGAQGLKRNIPLIAREVLRSGKVKMGLGLVENAYDQTMRIEAVLPGDMEAKEQGLLALCRGNMPSLAVDALDILLVDRMGKDISGSGMDTNIIGRMRIRGEAEPERPDINTILVADLTEGSHGNAIGAGLADVITKRLRDKIDYKPMLENALTSTFMCRGQIPITGESDRESMDFALRVNEKAGGNLRVIRIDSTLRLDVFYASKPVIEELRGREDIELLDGPYPLLDGEDFVTYSY